MGIFTAANIDEAGKVISLQNGQGGTTRFHAIWLRDNAPDPETRSTGNGQKLITVSDIPSDITVSEVSLDEDGLEILFEPEKKTVTFNFKWLQENTYDCTFETVKGRLLQDVESWDNSLSNNVPVADFSDLKNSDNNLAKWLSDVRRYGFAKITGGRQSSGALLDVVGLFGFVRETNYGKWFDVRSEVNPTNLAYTGLGLQAHTDNPYRDPVPTLQILYCLENSVTGGDSSVVDGFKIAERVKAEAREHFDILSRYSARFEYIGEEGACLQSKRPMIELSPEGELIAIRYNNRSCAPLIDIPFDEMELYYQAYRHFSDIVNDPAMSVSFKLAPGECFIVDNMRILHARKSFEGTGSRWLQGCYADKDGLLSRLAVIEKEIGAQQ